MILLEFHIFGRIGPAETRAITGFYAAKIADFLVWRGFADGLAGPIHKNINWQRYPDHCHFLTLDRCWLSLAP